MMHSALVVEIPPLMSESSTNDVTVYTVTMYPVNVCEFFNLVYITTELEDYPILYVGENLK